MKQMARVIGGKGNIQFTNLLLILMCLRFITPSFSAAVEVK